MLAQNQTQERQTDLVHGPTRYGTCYSQCDAANKLQTLDYTGFFAQWVIYRFNNITGITIQMLKTTDAALRQRKKNVHCAPSNNRQCSQWCFLWTNGKGWHSIQTKCISCCTSVQADWQCNPPACRHCHTGCYITFIGTFHKAIHSKSTDLHAVHGNQIKSPL